MPTPTPRKLSYVHPNTYVVHLPQTDQANEDVSWQTSKKTMHRDYSAGLLRVPRAGITELLCTYLHGQVNKHTKDNERWQVCIIWGGPVLMRKAIFQPGQLFADDAF